MHNTQISKALLLVYELFKLIHFFKELQEEEGKMKDSKQPKLKCRKSIMIQNYEKILLQLNTFKIQCDRKRVKIIPIFFFASFN
jgi:hypothetical protein